jgi:hypothetical protein
MRSGKALIQIQSGKALIQIYKIIIQSSKALISHL